MAAQRRAHEGRGKSDVRDAKWIAQLLSTVAGAVVRAATDVRRLRMLTRFTRENVRLELMLRMLLLADEGSTTLVLARPPDRLQLI